MSDGFCGPCRSHFCPHVRPHLYADPATAAAEWEKAATERREKAEGRLLLQEERPA